MSTRIMYLRDATSRPVGCVAIQLDSFSSDHVDYQLSVLNPHDNFDRALARKIAEGRLELHPMSVKLSKPLNMHTISEAVMTAIAGDKNAPSRARRAADRWLRVTNKPAV